MSPCICLGTKQVSAVRGASETGLYRGCKDHPQWLKEQMHGNSYLEGHGNLASGLILGIIVVIVWFIGVIHLLTKCA